MTNPLPEPFGAPMPYEPVTSHEPAEPPGQRRRAIVAAVLVALVVAAFGGVVGWVWALVSPRLAVIKVEGGFVYADSEPEQPIAAEGWFAILGFGVGAIFAILVWFLLRRYRGTAILIGLVVGSLAASLIAWYVGYKIGYAEFTQAKNAAAIGDRVNAPLLLHITHFEPDDLLRSYPTGVGAVQALAAAFVYTCLAGFSIHPDLRGPRRSQQQDHHDG